MLVFNAPQDPFLILTRWLVGLIQVLYIQRIYVFYEGGRGPKGSHFWGAVKNFHIFKPD